MINISEGRKRHIKTVKHHRESYEKMLNQPITFNSFNFDMSRGFERFLTGDKKRPKGRNTMHTIMKMTRSF